MTTHHAHGPITTARLERALRRLAWIVVQPWGEVYTPLFERIEAELAQRRRQQDARARARELLVNQSLQRQGDNDARRT